MSAFSISLGRPFGIKTSIHWTFWILIVWIIISNARAGQNQSDILWYLLLVFAIFGCVILHELGHALAARRYGINTSSIIILPIGGVANLESIPEDPKQELIVAAAGPMVNVVIAALLFFFLSVSGNLIMDPEGLTAINGDNFLVALFSINIALVVFNLIPAFPMDGGRMLRAVLSFNMPRLKATEWAVTIGRFFAIVFVFLGFYGNPFLILIALFIYLAAGSELNYVRSQSVLKGYTVQDAMHQDFHLVDAQLPLRSAVDLLLNVQDQHFLVTENREVVGTLSKNKIIQGLSTRGPEISIAEVMDKNIIWLDPAMSLNKAQEMVVKRKLSVAPVRAGGQLVGIFEMENYQEFLTIKSMTDKEE